MAGMTASRPPPDADGRRNTAESGDERGKRWPVLSSIRGQSNVNILIEGDDLSFTNSAMWMVLASPPYYCTSSSSPASTPWGRAAYNRC
jgi:hypothetical protein